MGGLHVIGTERHEARRIDLQLRGRCGRQGDPGSSRFFLSLEDDLMRIFAGEWVKNMLTRLGMQEGEAIESRMVSRRIEGAQKKVEERNFEIRKNLLEYDEVMDEQRKRVYGYRQRILDGANCKRVDPGNDRPADRPLPGPVPRPRTTARSRSPQWAGRQLAVRARCQGFPRHGLRHRRDLRQGRSRTHGRDARSSTPSTRTCPRTETQEEWNWEALAKMANTRWRLSLRDRDLERIGRDGAGRAADREGPRGDPQGRISAGAQVPPPGLRPANRVCAGCSTSSASSSSPDEIRGLELPAIKAPGPRASPRRPTTKEVEYPVMAGLSHFTMRDPAGHKRVRPRGAGRLGQGTLRRRAVDRTI